jgi:nucleotide-binding universal stress UspA family protein
MPFRQILVVERTGRNNEGILFAAGWLAATFEAHVRGLCLYAPPNASVAECFAIGSRADESVIRHLEAQTDALVAPMKAEFRDRLAEHGAAGEWECIAQCEFASETSKRARLAELTVLGRSSRHDHLGLDLVEAVLLHGGARCLLIPEEGSQRTSFGRIVIAWNGSPQVRRAIEGALPLLQHAQAIWVVAVGGSAGVAEQSDLDALQAYLLQHGIHAEFQRLERIGHIAQQILDGCQHFGADLLVLGAYGRSRRAEAIFGGVTREILSKAWLPLLLAH